MSNYVYINGRELINIADTMIKIFSNPRVDLSDKKQNLLILINETANYWKKPNYDSEKSTPEQYRESAINFVNSVELEKISMDDLFPKLILPIKRVAEFGY